MTALCSNTHAESITTETTAHLQPHLPFLGRNIYILHQHKDPIRPAPPKMAANPSCTDVRDSADQYSLTAIESTSSLRSHVTAIVALIPRGADQGIDKQVGDLVCACSEDLGSVRRANESLLAQVTTLTTDQPSKGGGSVAKVFNTPELCQAPPDNGEELDQDVE